MQVVHKQLKSLPIHYYITGECNTPCIIFLHPAFANHRAFDKQLAYFSRDYKVITVDLIGHGNSQKIKTDVGIDSSSIHIREIMEKEHIPKAHFVGVSMGSLIAQDFANKYPSMLLSLCALGGYDINNYDRSIESEQRKQQIGFILKALISINWFSKSNALVTAKTQEAQNAFYEMNKQYLRRSFRYMTSLGNIMNQCHTKDRSYPVLILCGDSDNSLTLELAKKWADCEQNSICLTISNAGHCANMDNSVEFNEILRNFIGDKLPKRGDNSRCIRENGYYVQLCFNSPSDFSGYVSK